MRLITEFSRNSEIATVLAPAGTVADTASGAEDELVTLTEPADSGVGARRGAVAAPSGVDTGAVTAASVAGTGGWVTAGQPGPPAITVARVVGADVRSGSTLPRPSVTVAPSFHAVHWVTLIAGSVTVAVGSWFAWVTIGVVPNAEAPDASRYQRYVILDTPLGSLIVPRAPVRARSVSAAVGVIDGAPVTGC